METYTFLKQTYNEGPTTYFAIDPDKIEKLKLSDTYGRYGQKVEPGNAGDSVTLETEKAVKIANDAYNEFFENEEGHEYVNHFSLGDYINADDNSLEFDAVKDSSDLEENVDFEYNAMTCKGFNYWDGSNWASVIVESEIGEAGYEVIDDEDLEKELNKAIEEKQFIEEGFGLKKYEGGNYQIIYSQFAGAWENYSLIPLEEV